MSGWTIYSSGSDNEDERRAIVFDPRHVAPMTRRERAVLAEMCRERDRQTARETAGQLMTKAGIPAFKAFNGKAHRLVDGGRGITRALGATGVRGFFWNSGKALERSRGRYDTASKNDLCLPRFLAGLPILPIDPE